MNLPDEQQHRDRLRRLLLAREPIPADARELAQIGFERAALALTAGDDALASSALAEAAAAEAAAVLSAAGAHLADDAMLQLRWSDGARRDLPLGGASPGPSDWLRGITCALLMRDAESLEVLTFPQHVDAVQLPEHLADAFWPPLCRAIATLVREGRVDRASFEAAQAGLMPERIAAGDATVLAAQIAPLLALLHALAGEGDFGAALHAAQQQWLAGADPELDDPFAAVPLEALGLAALAADRGITFAYDGPGAALLHDKPNADAMTLRLAYRPRQLLHSEDASGFLDLRDLPREGREHDVVSRPGGPVARYRIAGYPGLPRIGAEFRLPGADESAPMLTLALDAGERLLLAERYGGLAGGALDAGDVAGAQAWLALALVQLDAVLAAIPDGAERVPESALFNARGRKLYDEEPGRFERERLTAYADTFRRLQQAPRERSRPDHGPMPVDASARQSALDSIELIKAQLTPLLLSLRNDRSGEWLAALRPRDEDYDKVFALPLLAEARRIYGEFWRNAPPLPPPSAHQTELQIHLAPAGMLRSDNELSQAFPSGYRAIAPWLEAHRVWLHWRYAAPGTHSGMAYDGLVWCDDHWALFPKPYQFLKHALQG